MKLGLLNDFEENQQHIEAENTEHHDRLFVNNDDSFSCTSENEAIEIADTPVKVVDKELVEIEDDDEPVVNEAAPKEITVELNKPD